MDILHCTLFKTVYQSLYKLITKTGIARGITQPIFEWLKMYGYKNDDIEDMFFTPVEIYGKKFYFVFTNQKEEFRAITKKIIIQDKVYTMFICNINVFYSMESIEGFKAKLSIINKILIECNKDILDNFFDNSNMIYAGLFLCINLFLDLSEEFSLSDVVLDKNNIAYMEQLLINYSNLDYYRLLLDTNKIDHIKNFVYNEADL